MRLRRRSWIFLVLLASWTGAGTARAQGKAGDSGVAGPTAIAPEADQRAREHFVVGRSYFEQARYEEAAQEFAEAYRLSGYPALLINLGMAHERALQYGAAIEAYERYLREAEAGAEWRMAARKRAARLRAIQAERAAKEGRRSGSVGERGLSRRDVWGLGVLGLGAGAAVAAVVSMLKADDLRGELANVCVETATSEGLICPETYGDEIDRGRRLSIAWLALGGTALAAVAAGVALILIDAGEADAEERERASKGRRGPMLSLEVAEGGAGASLRWRF